MAQRVQFDQCLGDGARTLRGGLGYVVPDDELALRLHPGDQLVELEGEEAAVGAQLHHVLGDLGGDPPHHLEPLRHRGDIADRHQVLDLQSGERARDLVEPELVPLQGGQSLIRAGQDRRGLLEDPALPVDVQRDQMHRLRYGDDREAALFGDPVRGAVAGAGLLGGDGRVGDQLDTGPEDLADVLVEDQRAVEFAQLTQARGGELDIHDETAGAHRLDRLVHAEDDQPAGVAAQDAFEAVAQRSTGRDGAQCGAHQRFGAG